VWTVLYEDCYGCGLCCMEIVIGVDCVVWRLLWVWTVLYGDCYGCHRVMFGQLPIFDTENA
jgi:hypothetical protein